MLWKRQSCSFASFQLRVFEKSPYTESNWDSAKASLLSSIIPGQQPLFGTISIQLHLPKTNHPLTKKTTNCYVFRALLVHLWVKTLTKYVRFPIKTSNSLGTSRQHCELEPFAPTPATTKLQTRYVPDFKTLWGTYAPFSWHVPS